jgi:hypothetical protein
VSNRFDNAKTIEEVIGQLAGAASLCWKPKPTGVFESSMASAFVGEALERLRQLGANLPPPYSDVGGEQVVGWPGRQIIEHPPGLASYMTQKGE